MWDPLRDLSSDQLERIKAFERLIVQANRRVNLVSRASLGSFETAHVRHSLALAIRTFPAGATVVDWGTGGGLPGIPLAIRFPDVQFILVDSIGRKTDFVRAMALKLGLENVEVVQSRAESWEGTCDFAVSRATAPLADLWSWTKGALSGRSKTEDEVHWSSGLAALKGGDLSRELGRLRAAYPSVQVITTSLEEFMGGPFEDKYIVEVG